MKSKKDVEHYQFWVDIEQKMWNKRLEPVSKNMPAEKCDGVNYWLTKALAVVQVELNALLPRGVVRKFYKRFYSALKWYWVIVEDLVMATYIRLMSDVY